MGGYQGEQPTVGEVESGQHALAPDRWFDPRPAGTNLFCRHIRVTRNSCRARVHRPRPHASTFLRPFAPLALPSFLTTMVALTPDRQAAPYLTTVRAFLVPVRSPCFTHSSMCHRSVSNHPMRPCHRFNTLPLSVTGGQLRAILQSRLRLRQWLAGSSRSPGRIEFVAYGPVTPFELLPTPPHGDAVTVRFRPESVCLEGSGLLCAPLDECAHRRTSPTLRVGLRPLRNLLSSCHSRLVRRRT